MILRQNGMCFTVGVVWDAFRGGLGCFGVLRGDFGTEMILRQDGMRFSVGVVWDAFRGGLGCFGVLRGEIGRAQV